jgi:hypothetical protein
MIKFCLRSNLDVSGTVVFQGFTARAQGAQRTARMITSLKIQRSVSFHLRLRLILKMPEWERLKKIIPRTLFMCEVLMKSD